MNFPKLKTGAIAQYPVFHETIRPASSMRFLDMARQTYLDGGSLRRWRLELGLLDESEVAALVEFFVAMRGSLGRFGFEDPVTGELVANCRFDSDEFVLASHAEFDGRTVLTVSEAR